LDVEPDTPAVTGSPVVRLAPPVAVALGALAAWAALGAGGGAGTVRAFLGGIAAGGALLLTSVLLVRLASARRLSAAVAKALALARQAGARVDARGALPALDEALAALEQALDRQRRAVRDSDQRFRLAFYTHPLPMTLHRVDDQTLVAANESFLAPTGAAEGELLGRTLAEVGGRLEPSVGEITARVAAERVLRDLDVRFTPPGGGEARIVSLSAALLDLGGVEHVLAVALDVTEARAALAAREELQRELRRGEERYRFVVRSVPVVQWALDHEGVFTVSEGQGLTGLGLRPGEVVGRSVFEVFAAFPPVIADFRRALAGERFETENDFGTVLFQSHWSPMRDDAGEIVGVVGIALDATRRREAEAARKESEGRMVLLERLAATGRLAAGVAHEINNPLTYVLSNLEELAQVEPLRAHPLAPRLLREAREGAERVRAIVRDLRVFARADDETGGSCDPAEVVRSALGITANEIRHRARLETRLEAVPRAAIAERRLAQVLVNLLVNACQAIPEGRAGEHTIAVAVRRDGDGVAVEVSDTGNGMTPEVRARIFEPFFTTRATGDGQGLGLALSHAMVAEAGGGIEVDTAPGRGATFRVRLRAAAVATEPPPAGDPLPAAARSGPARALRVLLVDDDPLVGKALARALAGFEVTVVERVADALGRLRAGAAFDAVVCDLMMPDQTGMDLEAALVMGWPDLARRTVFLTGGAFTERARAFVEAHPGCVLEKPVSGGVLRARIEALLEEPVA
jgi:PAS domain S-box-containing protein